jgi:tetratricopeptide (TPR) repeat protein
LARGAIRLSQKDQAAANADFDAVLHLGKDDPDNLVAIAQIYGSLDLHAEAIAKLTTWIDSFPKNNRLPGVLNSRCWERAMLGEQLDIALADCNMALKKGPRNSMVLDSRAFVHLRRGEYDQAIADYQAVLKLQPRQASSMYGLGLAELKKGLKATGEQRLQAAVALSPKIAEFYNKLGLVPE